MMENPMEQLKRMFQENNASLQANKNEAKALMETIKTNSVASKDDSRDCGDNTPPTACRMKTVEETDPFSFERFSYQHIGTNFCGRS